MKQTVKTSRAASHLEKMFRELNKHYFAGKLPEPIISLKKKTPPMVTSPAPRSGRQTARTSMRLIFRRLPLTVPSRRPPPPCCMRWCTSTAWRPASRIPATTGSITTGALRSMLRHTGCLWSTMLNTAGQSQAPPKSCWTSSFSWAGKTSRWVSGWRGLIWLALATAARHRAAARQVHPSRQRPRAAPGGGYAPSAGPSFAAPRKYGSFVLTAWRCS